MPDFDGDPGTRYDEVSDRDAHRITVLYSVDQQHSIAADFGIDYADRGSPIANHLEFDRLRSCYESAARHFPRVFDRMALEPGQLRLTVDGATQPDEARIWVLGLPQGSMVMVVTVEVVCSVCECIPVMEALHHKRFTISDQDPWDYVQQQSGETTRAQLRDGVFGVDVHQILYVAASHIDDVVDKQTGQPKIDAVSDLIYRYAGTYRDEPHFVSRIKYPAEPNRGLSTLTATGPYVGVIAGHQGYVENAFFVSAVQMVGASALLRRIRIETYEELLRLRRLAVQVTADSSRTRTQLAVMSERLGKLELELSFGVETHERIGSLIPSLRVIDYHQDLFSAADMPEEARTTGDMLVRLSRVIQSELEGVKARERTNDERRRLVGSLAIGVLTLVAVPLGVIFGYFGINTADVTSQGNFYDVFRYPLIYAIILGLVVVEAIIAVALYFGFRRADKLSEDHRISILNLE